MPSFRIRGIPLVFLLLIGCERRTDGNPDEQGAPQLGFGETASPAWQPGEKWRLVPDLWIGDLGMSDPRPDAFGELVEVAVDGAGRMYALDRINHRVQLFDSGGGHVRTLGGPGAGPGEMRNPIGIRLDSQDNLWLIDPLNQRYTVFDSAGGLLDTHPRRLVGFGAKFNGGFDGGDLLEFERTPEGMKLIRFDPRTEVFDTFPYAEERVAEDTEPMAFVVERGRRLLAIPFRSFGARPFAGGPRGHIWVRAENPREYALYLRTLSGDTVDVIRRNVPLTPVTREEVDFALNRPGPYRIFRYEVDRELVPHYKPAFHDFITDDGGFVWVWTSFDPQWERPEALRGRAEDFDVFDPDGNFLGTIELGPLVDDILAVAPPSVIEDLARLSASSGRSSGPTDTAESVLRQSLFAETPVRMELQAIRGRHLYATLKSDLFQAILRYRIEGRELDSD